MLNGARHTKAMFFGILLSSSFRDGFSTKRTRWTDHGPSTSLQAGSSLTANPHCSPHRHPGDNPLATAYKAFLAAGKPKRLALGAIMRKIITIANARLREQSQTTDLMKLRSFRI
jgi:hypothetical protein